VSSNQAYLIKGWLLGANAPEEVWDALGAIIAMLSSIQVPMSPPEVNIREESEPAMVEAATELIQAAPPRKKREWSPEAKAAAAERMRARQAAGLMKRKSAPGEAPAPSQAGA
jgi:hypothetical protein